MKISDLIHENTEKLIETLQKAEAESYRNTSCEYRVYIDSEGECGYEEWLAGDSGYYQFLRGYCRYYIHTFCKQYFDIVSDWWFANHDEPKEYDREAIMEEAIEAATNSSEALDGYKDIIEYAIGYAILAEREEEYSE